MKRTLRSQSDFQKTLLRNQLTSLVLYEKVVTTQAKAKDLHPFVDHFFNRIKPQDLTAKRYAHQLLLDTNAVKKVFEEILPRYKKEETTFVREYRMMPRRGDSAAQRMITFIHQLEAKTEKPAEATAPAAKESKAATKNMKKLTAKKAS